VHCHGWGRGYGGRYFEVILHVDICMCSEFRVKLWLFWQLLWPTKFFILGGGWIFCSVFNVDYCFSTQVYSKCCDLWCQDKFFGLCLSVCIWKTYKWSISEEFMLWCYIVGGLRCCWIFC
jgi:hypothetical protein